MISYCLYKHIKEDVCDYDELALNIFLMSITIILDILFLIFQPIFYKVVMKYEKENN